LTGGFHGSVSTALNVEFLAAAKKGQVVVVHSRVDKVGRTQAFLGSDFYLGAPAEGRLLYRCRHQKHIDRTLHLSRDTMPAGVQTIWDTIQPSDDANDGGLSRL